MGRDHGPAGDDQGAGALAPGERRYLEARRVTLGAALLSLVLAGLQAVLGWIFQSRALVADAVHSLSDLVTDAVVWVGMRLAAKPADHAFPFGRGKFETLAAIVVALMLGGIAVGIAVDAGAALVEGRGEKELSGWLLPGAFLGIVTKEWIYRWTIRVGRRLQSPALIANAWHHRSDALSSVAVLLGIGGALAFDAWWLDPVAAMVVAGMIFRVTLEVLRESSRSLVDASVPEGLRQRIVDAAVEDPAVVDVHSLRARPVGSAIYVDLHAVVHPEMKVGEACQVADRLERHVIRQVDGVVQVLVHVEPAAEGVILPPPRVKELG